MWSADIAQTGRFVLVDNYEIAGGGIILAPVFDSDSSLNQQIKKRDYGWERSHITPQLRAQKYQHKSLLSSLPEKLIQANSVLPRRWKRLCLI